MLQLEVKFESKAKDVTKAFDRAAARTLKRFGGLVKTVARRSLKRPTKKEKENGRTGDGPPRNQTGLLKNSILFDYLEDEKAVIIGPTKLGGTVGKGSQEALEKGGTSTARVFVKGKKRKQKRRIKVRPRPYMEPALQTAAPKLEEFFQNVMNK